MTSCYRWDSKEDICQSKSRTEHSISTHCQLFFYVLANYITVLPLPKTLSSIRQHAACIVVELRIIEEFQLYCVSVHAVAIEHQYNMSHKAVRLSGDINWHIRHVSLTRAELSLQPCQTPVYLNTVYPQESTGLIKTLKSGLMQCNRFRSVSSTFQLL